MSQRVPRFSANSRLFRPIQSSTIRAAARLLRSRKRPGGVISLASVSTINSSTSAMV